MSNLLDYKPTLGKHSPLISISDFQRINGIIDERPYSKAGSDDVSCILPLKIHLRCSKCGAKFTGYVNKKKKKAYCICNNQDCRINVSATTVNTGFADYMQRLIPLSIRTAQIKKRFSELIEAVKEHNQNEVDKINTRLTVIQHAISTLTDKLLIGTISDQVFKEKLKELEQERHVLEEKLDALKIDYRTRMKLSKHVSKLLENQPLCGLRVVLG